MSFVLADRVKETTTSPGTGTATLSGAVTGYQSFSAGIGANNTTYYVIADASGPNWEVGYGTVGAGGTTLARTTVLASSNSGSLVNFSSGTQNVWCDYAAGKAVIQDANGVVTTPVLNVTSTTSTTPNLSFNASNSGFTSGASISGSYLQTVIQNKSGTAGASTNYVLSNNLGTDSTYYGEFGMNSSVYSSSTPSDFFSINNGIYFSGHDGDISVGSGNGYKTYMAWGTTGNNAHVINASGAIGLSTNLGTTPALSGTTGFGTSGQVLTSQGSAAAPIWTTPTTGTVTSVTGTSPIVSSGGATPAISLAASYGDTQNPYASKTANYILAAPSGSAGVPTFRAVTALDLGTGSATSSTYLRGDLTWQTISSGISVTNDTSTATALYPTFTSATSGSISGVSVTSTKLTFVPSTGVLSATSVAGTSDERLKTNWTQIAPDFLEKLANVKSGIYDRTDVELTQAGVSAQSLQEVLPEAVLDNGVGYLSVAYGNAALVAAIELAKEVKALRAEIEILKAK
jgi:Chaperone of endosialidase